MVLLKYKRFMLTLRLRRCYFPVTSGSGYLGSSLKNSTLCKGIRFGSKAMRLISIPMGLFMTLCPRFGPHLSIRSWGLTNKYKCRHNYFEHMDSTQSRWLWKWKSITNKKTEKTQTFENNLLLNKQLLEPFPLYTRKNENTRCQSIWYIVKIVLRWKSLSS